MIRPVVAGTVLACTLAFAPPFPARGQDWQVFHPEGGSFRVEMPAPPVATTMETTSFIGKVTDHVYTATLGEAQFAVTWTRLPAFVLDCTGTDTIYDHASAALLEQVYGRRVSFGPIEAGGRRGRRLVYQLPAVPGKAPASGEAQFFLVGDTLYSVDAIVASGSREAEAKRFLDGFEVR